MRSRRRAQAGFTVVELIITTCIVAILASISVTQMRDYTRRARMSEAVIAGSGCKNAVQENYPVLDSAPGAGRWGCEGSGSTKYAGVVQTSRDGVIRITIQNMDPVVNGRHVFLVPAKVNGAQLVAPDDLGNPVRNWICGSDWSPVLNALPANCRTDATTWASADYL